VIRSVAIAVLCISLLQACAIRFVTVHDGLKTVVVDEDSEAPVAEVGVYSFGFLGEPKLVAKSDGQGAVQLDQNSRLRVMPLIGEAIVELQLWVCKDGFEPRRAAIRGGWNADYRAETHDLTLIKLKRDKKAPPGSCQSRIYNHVRANS
jgi:hypothetical protein